jgi:F-type H+-transporting ATPase subunit delta
MAESRDITAEHARTAAQVMAEVGVEHIAQVYAKGLLGATEKAGQTAAVIEEFDGLMAEVFDRFARFEVLLASVLVSPEEKSTVIDRVLTGRVSTLLLNFLKVVAAHGRLDCLRAIHSQVHTLDDVMRNRIRVRFTTAAPLSPVSAAEITEQLRALLSGEPVLEQATDPSLIGGAVLRIGDTVYDGSVANQLHNLRQEIIARSAHEIQSRRDRFRNSAGN